MQGHPIRAGLRGRHVQHRAGPVAGRYIETPLQERQEALAGAASGIQHACAPEAVPAGLVEQPSRPQVIVVMGREPVIKGRERVIRFVASESKVQHLVDPLTSQ